MQSNKTLTLIVIVFSTTLCFGRIVNVGSATQFKAAISAIQAGDTILVQDGTYDLNSYLKIPVSGTKENPILIKAKNRGGVTFINKSYFNPQNVSYITIEGFIFAGKDGTAIKLESCTHCRITRNIFRLQETIPVKWILVGDVYSATQAVSSYNRIDHNLFENKTQPGNCITIDGFQGTPARSSQYDRIDHNHFRNVGPRVPNEMETIRVGVTSLTGTPGYTVIEYNLFEDCDGDPEFVSIKTDEDTVRYNTFRSCQGTLCLRQTSRSYVEGNYFFGNGKAGTGGVRVYNKDNKVIGNYFINLTGMQWDAACTITNGDVDSNSTSQSSHFRPIRTIFAFNTLINCESNFELGFTNSGAYGKPPRDNVVANNIVVATRNPIVKLLTTPINQVWQGNIFFPKETATIGITATNAQILNTDPVLQLADSLWRLTPASPAINASLGVFDYVRYDIDGQLRSGIKDIGADEYATGSSSLRPMNASDVGPDGGDMVVANNRWGKHEVNGGMQFDLLQNYPNPFNPSTTIRFQLTENSYVKLTVYDMAGTQTAVLVEGTKTAGVYEVDFTPAYKGGMSSGVYLYRLQTGTKSITKKMILVK
ncbi:MAG: T9SS type A sorting domain-containing protein [Ignavibacteriales bacterium]|nr:T9SS type A sorting domain-containing protein [Ignavibacteriales bacterium]